MFIYYKLHKHKRPVHIDGSVADWSSDILKELQCWCGGVVSGGANKPVQNPQEQTEAQKQLLSI